jgi:capsular polysaccharide biosynthesis protein
MSFEAKATATVQSLHPDGRVETDSESKSRAPLWDWAVAAIVLAASIGAAAALTARETPLYRSSALVAVYPNSEVEGAEDILRSLDTLERRTIIATLARLASTSETAQQAAEQAQMDARDIGRFRLNASVLPNTNLLRIEVEGPDANGVASFANAAAAVLSAEARSLYRIYALRVVGSASPASRPFSPDRRRHFFVAVVVGVIAAGATLLASRRLRARRRTAP